MAIGQNVKIYPTTKFKFLIILKIDTYWTQDTEFQ